MTTVKTLDFPSLQEYVNQNGSIADQTRFEDGGWSLAGIEIQRLMEKIRQNSIPLGEYVKGKIYRGGLTGLNEAFVIDQSTLDRLIAEDPKSAELIKPFAIGRDIKRYMPIETNQYLILIPKGWTNERVRRGHWKWFQSEYPAIAAHLAPFEQKASKRADQGDYWWELRACAYYDEFEKPKIVYPNICKKPEFTFDRNGNYTNQKAFIIPVDDLFLLGILNSSVMMLYFENVVPKLRGDFYEPGFVFMKDFPVPIVDNSSDIKGEIEVLVTQMLSIQLKTTYTPQEANLKKRELDMVSSLIDGKVRSIYGI